MRNVKTVASAAVAAALACTFGMGGLAACSNGGEQGASTGSASSSAASSVSTQADEDAIRQDIEDVIGAVASKDAILEGLRKDSTFAQYEQIGLDVAAYAENMSKIVKFEVPSVEVDGDKAVAKAQLTLPNFGTEANALMEKAVEKATKGIDPSSMSTTEQMALMVDTMSSVLADPDFPTETSDFDIDYERVNGTWTMEDKDEVPESLNGLANAAAGLQ